MKTLRYAVEEPVVTNTKALVSADLADRERWGARLASKMEVYCDWLTGHPMTQRERTILEIRHTQTFLFSITNGLVTHLHELV